MNYNNQSSVNTNTFQHERQRQEQQRLSAGLDLNQTQPAQPSSFPEEPIYTDTFSESLMQHFIQDHALHMQQQNYTNNAHLNILDNSSVPTLNLMTSHADDVTSEHSYFPDNHQHIRNEQDVFNELLQMAAAASASASSSAAASNSSNTNNTSWLNEYNVDQFDDALFTAKENEQPLFEDSFLASKSNDIYLKPLESTISKIQDIHTPLSSEDSDRSYILEVVQQPARARMCGFGDKDRRPISPPPILKLSVLAKNGSIVNPAAFDVSFLVVTCDAHQEFETLDAHKKPKIDTVPTVVIDEHGKEQYGAVRMRNLAGASVASAEKLYDLDDNLGIFFIFQDISLRTEGVFRLVFSLIDIEEPPFLHTVNTKTASPVLKTVETNPFTSYTPKNFPGVVQSTPLSECFARQGIKIPMRKEKPKKPTKYSTCLIFPEKETEL